MLQIDMNDRLQGRTEVRAGAHDAAQEVERPFVGGARDAGAEVTLIDLRDYSMPLYNGDLEESHGLPEAAVRMKALFKSHHGLLIASPEYNGSITPLLKNTLDWVSRPHGEESGLAPYEGRLAALIAAQGGTMVRF